MSLLISYIILVAKHKVSNFKHDVIDVIDSLVISFSTQIISLLLVFCNFLVTDLIVFVKHINVLDFVNDTVHAIICIEISEE